MTTIIAGFPGVGKTWAFEGLPFQTAHDSDSSKFKHNWPTNYLGNIRLLYDSGSYDYIFTSAHKEVIQGLIDDDLEPVIVYPARSLKHEYIDRYERRGSPKAFVDLMDARWDAFIDDMEAADVTGKIRLGPGRYLYDFIKDSVGDL